MRTGSWLDLQPALSQCGEPTDLSWFETRWKEQLSQARQVLGPDRGRAAEDRGAAMSLATAAGARVSSDHRP